MARCITDVVSSLVQGGSRNFVCPWPASGTEVIRRYIAESLVERSDSLPTVFKLPRILISGPDLELATGSSKVEIKA